MADDTTSSNATDLPKTPQNDSRFLSAESIPTQEGLRDAAPVAGRPVMLPGRRPLFRN